MSGPKHIDIHVMEQLRQQQEAERKRQLEEERRKKEQQQIQLLNDQIAVLNQQVSANRQQLSGLNEQAGNPATAALKDSGLNDRWSLLIKRIQKAVQQSAMVESGQTLAELTVHQKRLQLVHDRTTYELAILQDEMKSLLEAAEHEDERLRRVDFSEQFSDKVRKDRRQISLQAAASEASQAIAAAESFNQHIQPLVDHPFFLHRQEAGQLVQAVDHILKQSSWSDEDKYTQITLRRKAWDIMVPDYEAEIRAGEASWQKYLQKKMIYVSLTELVGAAAQEILLQALPPVTELIQIALDRGISVLEEEWARKGEEEYIIRNVNEVMDTLGFEHMATDVMKTPKRTILHNMYALSEHEAVNVFLSDQGSVMFEVTGFSDQKKEMSSLERLKIKEAMESFCDQYEDIKEQLSRRGINVQNEQRKPAEEKYARMIDLSMKQVLVDRKAIGARVKNKRIQKQDHGRS